MEPVPNIQPTTALTPEQREQWRKRLSDEIESSETRFRASKDRWNRLYYVGLYGGIGLPALAALVLKLESLPKGTWKVDVASLFAVLGAICASALSAGSFRKRWAVSRTARTSLHKVRVDALRPDADLGKVEQALKDALTKYNESVVDDDD